MPSLYAAHVKADCPNVYRNVVDSFLTGRVLPQTFPRERAAQAVLPKYERF
jgi:hypothetical protein